MLTSDRYQNVKNKIVADATAIFGMNDEIRLMSRDQRWLLAVALNRLTYETLFPPPSGYKVTASYLI